MTEKSTDTVLETERLILRKWRESDIEPFMQHLNTRNVMRWLGGVQSREKFDAAVSRWRNPRILRSQAGQRTTAQTDRRP